MKAVLVRTARFSCGHKYYNPNWSESKNQEEFGLCYSEHGHGHNYKLEVHVESSINSESGMTINLKELDPAIENITDCLDHKFLNNDLKYFNDKIPTTENIAVYIYQNLIHKLEGFNVRLKKIVLYENDDLWVEYQGE